MNIGCVRTIRRMVNCTIGQDPSPMLFPKIARLSSEVTANRRFRFEPVRCRVSLRFIFMKALNPIKTEMLWSISARSPVRSFPATSQLNSVRILNYGILLPLHPKRKKITHITRNKKNKNLAIPADAAAMPPNPHTAATRAIIRKVTAQPNIVFTSFLK